LLGADRPIGGKNFRRPHEDAEDRSLAPSRGALAAPTRASALRLRHARVTEVPVPQAFLRFVCEGDRTTPPRRAHAPRRRGRTTRRADASPPRAVAVHHSLSGFAVFFVVL
jgi:hypothetical protein